MKYRRQVGADHLVIIDVDALENALVQVAPSLIRRCEVVLLRLPEQRENAVELSLKMLLAGLSVNQTAFRTGLRQRDALLLGPQHVDRDRVGVVRL